VYLIICLEFAQVLIGHVCSPGVGTEQSGNWRHHNKTSVLLYEEQLGVFWLDGYVDNQNASDGWSPVDSLCLICGRYRHRISGTAINLHVPDLGTLNRLVYTL
jgi:hypothetical protein